MNAIKVIGEEGLPRMKRRIADLGPTHLGSLDVRGLRARVEDVDGEPVLLIDDGDVEIEFSSGMGGTWDQAIAGAERLAGTVAAYAAELRRRGPTHRVAVPPRTDPST
jgi:hypothetical protein